MTHRRPFLHSGVTEVPRDFGGSHLEQTNDGRLAGAPAQWSWARVSNGHAGPSAFGGELGPTEGRRTGDIWKPHPRGPPTGTATL